MLYILLFKVYSSSREFFSGISSLWDIKWFAQSHPEQMGTRSVCLELVPQPRAEKVSMSGARGRFPPLSFLSAACAALCLPLSVKLLFTSGRDSVQFGDLCAEKGGGAGAATNRKATWAPPAGALSALVVGRASYTLQFDLP